MMRKVERKVERRGREKERLGSVVVTQLSPVSKGSVWVE